MSETAVPEVAIPTRTVEIDSQGPQIGTDLNSLLSGAKKPEEK